MADIYLIGHGFMAVEGQSQYRLVASKLPLTFYVAQSTMLDGPHIKTIVESGVYRGSSAQTSTIAAGSLMIEHALISDASSFNDMKGVPGWSAAAAREHMERSALGEIRPITADKYLYTTKYNVLTPLSDIVLELAAWWNTGRAGSAADVLNVHWCACRSYVQRSELEKQAGWELGDLVEPKASRF